MAASCVGHRSADAGHDSAAVLPPAVIVEGMEWILMALLIVGVIVFMQSRQKQAAVGIVPAEQGAR